MVIYAKAWHTASCLCSRKGLFVLLVLAETFMRNGAGTFTFQLQVLPVCYAKKYLLSEQAIPYEWIRYHGILQSCTISLPCHAAAAHVPAAGSSSLQEISPLFGVI